MAPEVCPSIGAALRKWEDHPATGPIFIGVACAATAASLASHFVFRRALRVAEHDRRRMIRARNGRSGEDDSATASAAAHPGAAAEGAAATAGGGGGSLLPSPVTPSFSAIEVGGEGGTEDKAEMGAALALLNSGATLPLKIDFRGHMINNVDPRWAWVYPLCTALHAALSVVTLPRYYDAALAAYVPLVQRWCSPTLCRFLLLPKRHASAPPTTTTTSGSAAPGSVVPPPPLEVSSMEAERRDTLFAAALTSHAAVFVLLAAQCYGQRACLERERMRAVAARGQLPAGEIAMAAAAVERKVRVGPSVVAAMVAAVLVPAALTLPPLHKLLYAP